MNVRPFSTTKWTPGKAAGPARETREIVVYNPANDQGVDLDRGDVPPACPHRLQNVDAAARSNDQLPRGPWQELACQRGEIVIEIGITA